MQTNLLIISIFIYALSNIIKYKHSPRLGVPYDVAWIDIEHTINKRYLTWDTQHYPDPTQLQNYLADKGRKTVAIVDPHIKVDGGYHVYKEAESPKKPRKGGAPNHYFVEAEEGGAFQGECWPGGER